MKVYEATMKTLEDFEHDRLEALKIMRDFLKDKGYEEVEVFTNMNGDDAITVQVEDEEYKEQVGYVATFERY